MPEGIEVRHRKACARAANPRRRCTCSPTFRASVWSPREQREIRRSFPTEAAARLWRADATALVSRGRLGAGSGQTLRAAADELLAAMRRGEARTRSGDPYKPSTIRSYEESLRLHVLDDLGGARLRDISRRDLQALVDRMHRDDASASAIRNAVIPLRVIWRRALRDGEVYASPLDHLELPAVRGRRERIATPAEAAALIAAVAPADRPVWATALYAGLRRGELQGLRVDDVDLREGVVHVRQSWDPKEHAVVAVKSRAGRRRVPVPGALRAHLAAHLLALGRREGLMFPGRRPDAPFSDHALTDRAKTAWAAASLAPITLHECRHTFASLCIAAGVNAKAMSAYLGHASIAITFDRYGHLMPGNEDQAVGLLDALLGEAQAAAEGASS